MMLAYWQLMRFHKPVGTFLLLWPTYFALWLACDGMPAPKYALIFTLGVVLMRALGCVINDIADRSIDKKVKRTHNRPLASGALSLNQALKLAFFLALGALTLLGFLNMFSWVLAGIAAFMTATYPYTKRFFKTPQLYLGITFSLNNLMAFGAIQNQLPLNAWLLFFANASWIVAYDTQYALIDKADDIKIGVQSTAIAWEKFLPEITVIWQILFCALMASVGLYHHLTAPYWISLIGIVGVFGYQFLQLQRCNQKAYWRAFLSNQYVGFLAFVGLVLHDWLQPYF